jgi:hypothetical protein
MTQNSDSTSTTLPTTRKARRAHSQHKRPMLVSSGTQGVQKSQGDQVETSESEISNGTVNTGPLVEASAATETPEVAAKAQRSQGLPKFFSKVEKNVEESETSREEVVKARLARAQKTTSKAEGTSEVEATPEVKKTKEKDEKAVRATSRTTTPARPGLFKTRHFIGMLIYLLGAETLIPLEGKFCVQLGIDHPGHPLAQFTVFNIPMQIMPSVILNAATLVILLLLLVKFDLFPSTTSARTTATARAQQERREQRTAAEKALPPTVRQGVKGEDDDLYHAYRSNQRREKKH